MDMEFERVDRKKFASSDGSLSATMLAFFETGIFYDCSFQVGLEGTDVGLKNYKCHKMILSASSVVFETMFYGAFKEANTQRDDPILLKEVSTESFECAMRFIYGREKIFKKPSLAIQVYRFAHEMQIDLLLKEAEKFIIDRLCAASVFAAFDLFKFLDNEMGLKECKIKILKHQTEEALDSSGWLNMRLESVLDFLQMDFMDVRERDLVRALLKWGRAQVLRDNQDPEDGQKLRLKILPCFKFINFHMLSNKDFVLLCEAELGQVLSFEEKFLVVSCNTQEKWNTMPQVLSLAKQPPRLKTISVVKLDYRGPDTDTATHYDSYLHKLLLEVDRNATLIGFKLVTPPKSPVIEKALRSFKVTLINYKNGIMVGTGCSEEKLFYQGEQYFKVKSVSPMAAGVPHALKIELPSSVQYTGIPFTLESSVSYKCNANYLKLSLHNQGTCNRFAAKVSKLIFENL